MISLIGAIWRGFKSIWSVIFYTLWVLGVAGCIGWAAFIIWMVLTGQWSAGVFT